LFIIQKIYVFLWAFVDFISYSYPYYVGVYLLNIKYVCTVCLIIIQFHPLTVLTLTSKGVHGGLVRLQKLQRSEILFIFPNDAHYYKIVEMLKQFKNYDTCSDMFRFTQEPSSGSSPVLS
jgi:hypothetical protein